MRTITYLSFFLAVLFISIEFTACQSANKVKKNSIVDYEKIRQELLVILKDDQSGRKKVQSIEQKHGQKSKEVKEAWRSINKKDTKNLKKVTAILEQHGWLSAECVGDVGYSALFLVIQHADFNTQQKYLPMMRKASENGDAPKSSLALLEDRILMRSGKKQLYGSQICRDPKTGKWVVHPISNPEQVDERRLEMGLSPLAKYVKNWDIEWNVQEHKKQLFEPIKEAR